MAKATALQTLPEARGRASGPGTQPIRALMLDDSRFDRNRLRRLGQEAGLKISFDEAATIEGFRQALDQDDYDLILVDYHLPEGDGLEALDDIKSSSRNAGCPTIMVAGRNEAEIAVAAMRRGCLDYVCKDHLSALAFRHSIDGAMERAQVVALALHAQNEVEKRYRAALQSALARTVRGVRDLKSSMRRPNSNIPAGLQSVEEDCLSMWAILAHSRQQAQLSPHPDVGEGGA